MKKSGCRIGDSLTCAEGNSQACHLDDDVHACKVD